MTKSKEQAVQAGHKLLKLMRPRGGWHMRVWYNFGWHAEVYQGPFSVRRSEYDGSYSCGMSDQVEGGNGTPVMWALCKSFKDPNRAVREQVAHARSVINYYLKAVVFGEHLVNLTGANDARSNRKPHHPLPHHRRVHHKART